MYDINAAKNYDHHCSCVDMPQDLCDALRHVCNGSIDNFKLLEVQNKMNDLVESSGKNSKEC